jgi:preflagellin peptidase FlaK
VGLLGSSALFGRSILFTAAEVRAMVATTADLIRLVVVLVLAWAAWRDLKTRRVPNRIWVPLLVLGGILLVWEAVFVYQVESFRGGWWLYHVGANFVLVVPLAGFLWWQRAMGAADIKAIITLAVLLPTVPAYSIGGATYPLAEATHGIFSLTVLTNAVLLTGVIPLVFLVQNLIRGWIDFPGMVVSRRVDIESLPDRAGKLVETPAGFDTDGLDLDVLRMYLRWREVPLATLRANREVGRNPMSIGETHPPSDGRFDIDDDVDWGNPDLNDALRTEYSDKTETADETADDEWGAAEFFDSVDQSTYGVDITQLRRGLDVVTDSDRDQVAVTLGVPFIPLLFVGLVIALTYGDLLFKMLFQFFTMM